MTTPDALKPITRLLGEHRAHRHEALNLVASKKVMSPTVESFFTPELSHRYSNYSGTCARARTGYALKRFHGSVNRA